MKQFRRTVFEYFVTTCVVIAFFASVVLGSYLLHGCAARVASTPTVPGRAATPMENVLAWNAALANANLAVANNVIAAQQTTPPLITVDQANAVLTAQSLIADGDRQLTFVLQNVAACLAKMPAAATCKGNATQIGRMVAQIEAGANNIVVHDLAIKDAKTAASVTTAMNTIFTLAQQIIGTMQAGGLLQ